MPVEPRANFSAGDCGLWVISLDEVSHIVGLRVTDPEASAGSPGKAAMCYLSVPMLEVVNLAQGGCDSALVELLELLE